MPIFRADLHVHTVLSPCADTEMIPPLIVQEAEQKGIDIIAVTDHNATGNIEAVMRAARGSHLHVFPGMELQTSEEVHTLCLFENLEQVRAFQQLVDSALPDQENNIDFFGEQFIVDHTGEFIRREERLLLTSTTLTLNAAWNHVRALGGILIPAHVNRKAFGLFQILGFVPSDIDIDVLEISTHITPDQARSRYPTIMGRAIIQNGDAHFLEDIHGLNLVTMENLSIEELHLALINQQGRQHRLLELRDF